MLTPPPPSISGWETLTATCNTVYGSTTALYDFAWNPDLTPRLGDERCCSVCSVTIIYMYLCMSS